MAALSSLSSPAPATTPALTDAQRQALVGYGTALTGTTIGNGQTFGGGLNGQQWVDRLNAAFPGVNASLQSQGQNENGQDMGSVVNYDTAGLPAGWQQAITGPTGGVEFSDPSSHYNYKGGTDNQVINPANVVTDPTWGTHTSNNNIKQPVDNFDRYLQTGIFATIAAMTGGALAPMLGAAGGAAGSAAGDGGAVMGAGDLGAGASGAITGAGSAAGSGGGFLSSLASSLNPANIASTFTSNVSNPGWWASQAAHQAMNYGIGQLEGAPSGFNVNGMLQQLGYGSLGGAGSLASGVVNSINSGSPLSALASLGHLATGK